MVFAPDQARRAALQKATQQLAAAKNHASEANKILRDRDQSVANAKNVAKYAVPEGADAATMIDLTFGNDKGGLSQTLTEADLRQYAKNVSQAQTRFKGGITPQQVINGSRAIDIERSNKQIFLAAVFSRKADTFRYVTNASAQSKDSKHYVVVQFLGYGGQVTGTDSISTYLVKKNVTDGKIRFTCDCGRHKFYYNYLAGVGNYEIGAKEHRIPFIRNPDLGGLACKHVLRVMKEITSATGVAYIRTQINKDRVAQRTNLTQAVKTGDLKQALQQQAKKAHGKRAEIIPSEKTAAFKKKLINTALKAAKAQAAKVEQANADVARLQRLERSLRAGLITQEDYDFYSQVKK